MNQVTDAFTTPEVNGTWNSWCGNCNPMNDADGDGSMGNNHTITF